MEPSISQNMNPSPNNTNPKEKIGMSIFGANLLIFIAYYLVTFFSIYTYRTYAEILMWLLGLYVPHVLILFIISLKRYFRSQTRDAALYALTAFALLIIGFGACTAAFFLPRGLLGIL